MREIKFRTWQGGKFHYWGFIKSIYGSDYEFHAIADTNAEPLSMTEKMVRSQQYTGLKDKNGKEIYEGDIIQWWNGRELIGDAQVVEPTNGGWNPFIYDCQTDSSWHFEIIGNIHENKELLK